MNMRLARSLPVVLLAVAITACGSPVSPGRSLEAHILEFTGPGALNCGRLGKSASRDEMDSALRCALDAAGRGAAFSAVREHQGIDSAVAEGLVARPGGSVSRFTYDDAPCGNPGRCSESFVTEPCPAPRVATQPSGTSFGC